MEPAARAILGTPAVAPGHHSQLVAVERSKVLRTIDDVSRQRRHFFFNRWESSRAWRIRAGVDLCSLPFLRGSIQRSTGRRLLRGGDSRRTERRARGQSETEPAHHYPFSEISI